MRMPEKIEPAMFAPCGMNCLVCYKHCYHKKPCAGCLESDQGKPEHCRTCRIKDCVADRQITYCFECSQYPCKQIKSLEKSYNTRYHASLMENSQMVKEQGMAGFLAQQKEKYTCPKCGGIISIHDAQCSECEYTQRDELEAGETGMIDRKDQSHAPSIGEIGAYIGLPLFYQFCEYMDTEYKAIRKIEYSKDIWAQGWNVKFRKAGKSLCVVYPKKGYFTVLVVVGKKEKECVENVLPHLSKEIQDLYQATKEGNKQRWLMIDVCSDDCVYRDVLELIHIRRTIK